MSQDNDENPAKILAKAYEDTFSTAQGRIVLLDMMSRSRVFSTTFDINPHVATFNEGYRSFMIYVLEQLRFSKTDPNFYVQSSLDAKFRSITQQR